ncbi:MAG TPA: hypothetical protein ENI44_01910, partial [Thermoplasmatales archaeon]|nr:hypothetical protein [Thermoplasmatales archaeon]
MKFLCDQMLGTLAKWLRLLGFDTFYASSDISDDELLRIAEKEKRILITRDKQLIHRAEKNGLRVTKIETFDLTMQIRKVLQENNVQFNENTILSRCSTCNAVLEKVSKEEVKDLVPERVFQQQDVFWRCPGCGKIYWLGSHYDNM